MCFKHEFKKTTSWILATLITGCKMPPNRIKLLAVVRLIPKLRFRNEASTPVPSGFQINQPRNFFPTIWTPQKP